MFERQLPSEFRGREPSLESWTKSGLTPERATAVLEILAGAFRWKRADALRLRPDDKLWTIYHYYYPRQHWWQRFEIDELEMERLFRALQKEAPAIAPSDLHHQITLGEFMRLFIA